MLMESINSTSWIDLHIIQGIRKLIEYGTNYNKSRFWLYSENYKLKKGTSFQTTAFSFCIIKYLGLVVVLYLLLKAYFK